MKKSLTIKEIRDDLSYLSQYWTVLYGTYLGNDFIPGHSDIDVTIITQETNKKSNIELWKSFWGKYKKIYDIKIFELIPLYLKIEIIDNYFVLFGDKLEISEYFYHYRKIWKDMKFRYKNNQYQNIQEKINSIERRKILI